MQHGGEGATWKLHTLIHTLLDFNLAQDVGESRVTNFLYFYYCRIIHYCSIIIMTITNDGGKNGEKKTGRETKGTF